jgi:hypothetical protein
MSEALSLNLKAEPSFSELQIITINEVVRPCGYAIPGYFNFHVIVEAQNLRAEGWGTGNREEAFAKAKSEAIERHTFLLTSNLNDQVLSSNGWAAHVTAVEARDAAVAELIERDSALSAWFNQGPFLSVPRSLWPLEMLKWSNTAPTSLIEFGNAQVLLSVGANGCCATVILRNSSEGAVTGHASGNDLQKAILSAFFEAIRSAHAALRFDEFADVVALHDQKSSGKTFGPGANAMAYAYGVRLPSIDSTESTETEILRRWKSHQLQLSQHLTLAKVDYFNVGDRVVAHASLANAFEMFWGKTPDNLNVKNKRPHFVG